MRLTDPLKAALETLSTGHDPVLRDLAAGLLDGRIRLADVTTSAPARPRLQQAIDGYADWRASLSEEEFAKLVGDAQHTVAKLRCRTAADGTGHA